MKPIPPSRVVGSLLIYFATVFPGGALIAPWLYWFAHWAGQWHVLSAWAAAPFNRCLDRALLGLALLCLWPLLHYNGLRSWRELGFARQDRKAWQILKGFVVGWASLAAVVGLALVCGATVWVSAHSAADWFHLLLSATLTAAIVAVLEEFIFRGALFGLLRRGMAWPWALILSSAVYSAAHFIKKAEIAMPVQWYSGFSLLCAMLSHPPPMMPAFLTLLLAGSILALAYQRSGALYFSIGLHAGWIFWLKSYHFLFRPSGSYPSFWGTDSLIDGWLSCIALAILFSCVAIKSQSVASLTQRR
jgi:membrane protease YdiL (CAAX protease family)